MFSKLFALHPDVFGWQQLNEQYWMRHEFEPFNHIWQDPANWANVSIDHDFAVTSCSVPCVVDRQHYVPNVKAFIDAAYEHGWSPTVAVIGRDINILQNQQQRVRGEITLPRFLDQLDRIADDYPITFISHELAVLYRGRYLRELEQKLQFPVAWADARVEEILAVNANANYVRPANMQPADSLVWG